MPNFRVKVLVGKVVGYEGRGAFKVDCGKAVGFAQILPVPGKPTPDHKIYTEEAIDNAAELIVGQPYYVTFDGYSEN